MIADERLRKNKTFKKKKYFLEYDSYSFYDKFFHKKCLNSLFNILIPQYIGEWKGNVNIVFAWRERERERESNRKHVVNDNIEFHNNSVHP